MPDGPAQDLYGLPLSRFIPERDALVKRLRSEKQREEARAVAGMSKPSVAAWAVNQLVRTQSSAIAALFMAGDELARAQARAGPGKADALRGASRRQRDAIDELVGAAQGLLSSDGHPLTAATLERVRETLRAASIDTESRELVADGCLSGELRFAGLGIGGENSASPGRAATPAAKRKRPTSQANERADTRSKTRDDRAQRAEAERERTAAQQREREAIRRRRALSAARKALAQARRAATRADKEVAAADTRRQVAAASLQESDVLLAAATTRAAEAAAKVEAAERSVRDLDNGSAR